MIQKLKIKSIQHDLGIDETHQHYAEDRIQMENSEENLLKMVASQKKHGGVLNVHDRKLADKMVELGYEERIHITDEVSKDIETFARVDYFLFGNDPNFSEYYEHFDMDEKKD